MANTYTKVLLHIIFSTKHRADLIDDTFRDRLFEYMAGLARNELGHAVRIGGVPNHIHALIDLRKDVALSDAMQRWKSVSSGWVNKTIRPSQRFAWQTGYGAFSVSQSMVDEVIGYIDNQVEHHRTRTFEEEFIAFLDKYGIEYDPRYVWD